MKRRLKMDPERPKQGDDLHTHPGTNFSWAACSKFGSGSAQGNRQGRAAGEPQHPNSGPKAPCTLAKLAGYGPWADLKSEAVESQLQKGGGI